MRPGTLERWAFQHLMPCTTHRIEVDQSMPVVPHAYTHTIIVECLLGNAVVIGLMSPFSKDETGHGS